MLAEQNRELDILLRKAVDFHGHFGPFLVIGVRMGLIGMRELKAEEKRDRLRVTLRVKTAVPFSCVIDGVQVATKCTIGNKRMELEDSSGIAARFELAGEGNGVTVKINPAWFNGWKDKLLSESIPPQEVEKLAQMVVAMREEALFLICRKERWMDLEIAKHRLKEGNLNLVVAKGGNIMFESKSSGIRGLLQAIEKFGKELSGSAVADKIVGRAAAMLCTYSHVSAVFAVTISEKGRKMLNESNIMCQFEECVSHILNQQRTDICPFEKLAIHLKTPKEAYEKLKSFL